MIKKIDCLAQFVSAVQTGNKNLEQPKTCAFALLTNNNRKLKFIFKAVEIDGVRGFKSKMIYVAIQLKILNNKLI